MPLDIVVGTQWGDEGKGRVVDLLAAGAHYVARYNGGDNAGHTVTVGSRTFKLHLIPSGMIHPHTIGAIGNGVVVNPEVLLNEIQTLESAGIPVTPERLRLSYAAHLITPGHRALDRAQETTRGSGQLGTTLRGIGPTFTSKVSRQGLRLIDMLDRKELAKKVSDHILEINHVLQALFAAETLDPEAIVSEFDGYAKALTPFITDVSATLTDALSRGQQILAEGAQGTLLDLDHGTYPFVTSSTPTAPGALTGLGLGPGCVGRIVGVTKSFQTRVGAGPFPTEVTGDLATRLRGTGQQPWDEYGTTTGRPRRVGWLDMVLLRYAARINGLTELTLTKLDILSGLPSIPLCIAYQKGDQTFAELPLGPNYLSDYTPVFEELPGWQDDLRGIRRWESLPAAARAYILHIEELSRTPVRLVSVGPERDQVIEIP
jgi:adenylosuccinate synthase